MITKTILISMLTNHGFPPQDIPTLTCIAQKESNLNTKAINKFNSNGTRDHGLFQINDVNKKLCGVTSKQLLNVHINVSCAKKVYQVQNLKAWSTYNLCKKEIADGTSNDRNRFNNGKAVYTVRQQREIEASERRRSSARIRSQNYTTWAFIGYFSRSD